MKTLRTTTATLIAIVLAANFATPASSGEISNEIIRGRLIAPVPLKIPSGVDPLSVYLGSYLVEAVATCNSCHSNKEYTNLAILLMARPKQDQPDLLCRTKAQSFRVSCLRECHAR